MFKKKTSQIHHKKVVQLKKNLIVSQYYKSIHFCREKIQAIHKIKWKFRFKKCILYKKLILTIFTVN